ncbi:MULTISPECIES: hypothetical protein [unclassified Streptomyces]|uniref:hypothetical protein n=1 Tax=unclassified Streptomyces TaxID=2593676 RepID=UPI002024C002|nr:MULTISPECIES: hypothetical protein [unclassified Streptomyces]MCX4550561.1 hypothetical protein [Streptomyces sp. NBC_01500]WSC22008.1 hypothetical protein OIE60_21270 [Streptomyces sp. NBC_01766]
MSRTGPRNTYADYRPSEKMLAAIKAWEDVVEQEEKLRHAARAAIAEELRTARVSHGALAKHVPWTEATVTGIAKEYQVPPLRQRAPTTDNG